MISIKRLLTNICSDKLEESKVFYTSLFDFGVDFESDWFIHLVSKDKQLELGIINRMHEVVPKESQTSPEGFYITLVVEDVDAVHNIAQKEEIEIIAEPQDTFYGQRRLLLKDPNGVVLDVSAPIPGFQF